MFTALGSPKGALLGVSAAALILAITYSISAAPMRGIEVVRAAPKAVTAPLITEATEPTIELGLVRSKATRSCVRAMERVFVYARAKR